MRQTLIWMQHGCLVHGASPTKYDVSFWWIRSLSTICEIRWHHSQESHPMPDGRWRLTFRVAGLDEIKWWILGRGPAVVVESPPELATEVALLYAEPLLVTTVEWFFTTVERFSLDVNGGSCRWVNMHYD